MRSLFRTSFLAILLFFFSGCTSMRSIFLGYPDHRDIHRFPSSPIEAGDDCFRFQADESGIGARLKVNDWSDGNPRFVSLDELAASRPVRSLLVIQNDTLLYDFYGQGTGEADLHPSYSLAKSFTSALFGIAIQEGLIRSVDEKVVDHLPELKTVPGAEKLKIIHLLNMTSGISSGLQDLAKIYYGNDVTRVLNNLEFAYEPGARQEYLNINVQLLGLILHRATGKKPSEYLSEKIWKPLNMCSDAIWTTDAKGEDKAFCCMGATALDYAKFGRLYLNNGNWNGEQLVPESWVRTSLARDTSEGSSFGYNYLWHLGEKEYGDFMADGMYKQYIYVQPSKKVIIVLLCNRDNALKAERVQWRNIFKQIVDQL